MAPTMRLLSPLFFAGAAWGQAPFCAQELPTAQSSTAFDLVFVQAPLESELLTPYPAEMIHAFHTALVLVGEGNESWTLEFRAEDFMHAIFPNITVSSAANITFSALDWHASTAGFCFSRGVLHGRAHWTTWHTVARIPGAGVSQIVEFLRPLLVTSPWTYQLFSVDGPDGSNLLPDLSCGQGALAVVDFVNRTMGLPLLGIASAGELPITTVHLLASQVQLVGLEAEASVAKFYGDAEQVGAGKGFFGPLQRLADVVRALGDWKYLRVGTPERESYYRLVLRKPYLSITFGPRNASWSGGFPTQWLEAAGAGTSPIIV